MCQRQDSRQHGQKDVYVVVCTAGRLVKKLPGNVSKIYILLAESFNLVIKYTYSPHEYLESPVARRGSKKRNSQD